MFFSTSSRLYAFPTEIFVVQSLSAVGFHDVDLNPFDVSAFPEVWGNLTANADFDDDGKPVSILLLQAARDFSPLLLVINVIIDGCKGLKFKPIAYNRDNLATGFFHLSQVDDMSPVYAHHADAACKSGKRAVGYGREHVYEVQLSE
jgi:hypothetical protein